MTTIDKRDIELREILDTMEVPDMRKYLYYENLQWLVRNLGIKNGNHEKFTRAMILIKELIEGE